MPYIPNPIPILAVKFVGYTIAGAALRGKYRGGPHPLLFGLIRVACGFVVGLLTVPVLSMGSNEGSDNIGLLFLWLLITRLIVWSVLVSVMFHRASVSRVQRLVIILLGIAWSFALDGVIYVLDRQFDIFWIPMC